MSSHTIIGVLGGNPVPETITGTPLRIGVVGFMSREGVVDDALGVDKSAHAKKRKTRQAFPNILRTRVCD
jgi:hypothetical protein